MAVIFLRAVVKYFTVRPAKTRRVTLNQMQQGVKAVLAEINFQARF